jgi:hypothetical protein
LSKIFSEILVLIEAGEVQISLHGYDELAQDDIYVRDIMDSVREAKVVEEYPAFPKGPCVLLLQKDRKGKPMHVVWGIPKGLSNPAVLVTAYRPDPDRWDSSFTERKR